jgi:hypothetical protein
VSKLCSPRVLLLIARAHGFLSVVRSFARHIAAFVSSQGAVPAIQIAHSGRKGSVSRPWEGTQPLSDTDGAWETVCPSAVPFGDRKTALREMDETLIAEVIDAFRQSTRRAPYSACRSCAARVYYCLLRARMDFSLLFGHSRAT